MQPHLRKCFDNINRIKFTEEEESREVVEMVSAEPENMPELVKFSESVIITPDDKVENWLMRIQNMMVDSLRDLSVKSYIEFPVGQVQTRKSWIFDNYPAQSILLVEMVYWQQLVTEAVLSIPNNSNSLPECFTFWQKIMTDMVNIVCLDLNLL